MAKPTFKLQFNNWEQWTTYVARPTPNGVYGGSVRRFPDWSDQREFNYAYTHSYEEAYKLATAGWHAAEAEARKVSARLLRQVGSLIEQDVELYDVEGAGVDVAVFNSGEPECWTRNEQKFQESPGSIVKVVYNLSADIHTDVGIMITKGAAVAGMIECIELTGRSVELWIVNASNVSWYGNAKPYDIRVKVKEAGQPLDMGRVMFACAHPSSLRRLMWRAIELTPELQDWANNQNYGASHEIEDEGDIYIPATDSWAHNWKDEQQTRKFVVEKLRSQGIEIADEALDAPAIDIHVEKEPVDSFVPGGLPAKDAVTIEEAVAALGDALDLAADEDDAEADAIDFDADEDDAEADMLDAERDDGDAEGFVPDDDGDAVIVTRQWGNNELSGKGGTGEGEEQPGPGKPSDEGMPAPGAGQDEGDEEGDGGGQHYHFWHHPEVTGVI